MLTCAGVCYGQELSKPLYFFSGNLGISEYSLQNRFKVNAQNLGVSLGKEIRITEEINISAGIGYNQYFYDYNSLHGNTAILQIPIGVRHYFSERKQASFYSEIGFVNQFEVSKKLYNNLDGTTEKLNKIYGLSTYGEFGYTAQASPTIGFFVGINYSGSLLDHSKQDASKIKNQANLVLGFNVFRKP